MDKIISLLSLYFAGCFLLAGIFGILQNGNLIICLEYLGIGTLLYFIGIKLYPEKKDKQ